MGNITFTLIDDSEKRVIPEVDISTLDQIVGILSQSPETIEQFEALYHTSIGRNFYDSGNTMSDRLVRLFGEKKNLTPDEALRKMEEIGLGSREPNYKSFNPDDKTPYDIPESVDKGFNLCDYIKKIGDGILIVDLRAKEVSYLSPTFDITKSSGQYALPDVWAVKKYCLELRETQE